MKNNIKSILFAILFATSLFSWSQEEINHDVVVMKTYSPVIGDANKLSEQPEIIDTTVFEKKFDYRINSLPFYPNFSPKTIKPVKMVGEPLKKLYNHYVLAGFGNYTKPVFEYRYGSQRSKDLFVAFNFKHLSQNGNLELKDIEDKVYSGYSHNLVNVFLQKKFKNAALESDLSYHRYGLHQYGHNSTVDTTFADEDVKQVYSWMNATMRYKTTYLDSSHINHNYAIDYNYFEDYHSSFLNDISLGGESSLFLNKELISLGLNFHHYNLLTPSQLYSNTIYELHPKIKKISKKWGVEAGLGITFDSNNDSTLFHAHPKIKFHYNVIDYFLVPYLGISGEIESNNYRKIAQENPFVKPGLIVKNSNQVLVLNGGIRGNFTEKLSYNFSGSYSLIDDAYFFTNDSLNPTENTFVVEYDNIERMDIEAELSWTKSKKLSFMFSGKYHAYKLEKLEYAWHVPDYEIIFSTNYNLKSKIIIDFDMFVKGQRFAKTYYTNGGFGAYDVVKIPETFDMNLGIEYRYTKVLSGFLRVNNILARKNYLWNYYPTEGLNVTGGVIYSF